MTTMPISEERLKELAARTDDQIDYSDIPPLDAEWFKGATIVYPQSPEKQQLTMRLDKDLLDWFKGQGKGYQTRINAVLRAYYNGARAAESAPKKSRKAS